MTFNLFVQQTRPRDAFPVLISLLVLHAAPYNLAPKCANRTNICFITMEAGGEVWDPVKLASTPYYFITVRFCGTFC